MARQRMIHPDIWDSEQVQQLDCQSFKVYMYLISMANDDGWIKLPYKILPGKIFPTGGVTDTDIKQIAYMMAGIGLIEIYEKDGTEYAVHPNWDKFQKIRHPAKSKYPDIQECKKLTTDSCKLPAKRSKNEDNDGKHTAQVKLSQIRLDQVKKEKNKKPKKVAIKSPNTALLNEIQAGVLKRIPETSYDFAKEGMHIKKLIGKAEREFPDNVRGFLGKLFTSAWEMKETGTFPFHEQQPFLPSVINASGIYPRILEYMREHSATVDMGEIPF